MRHLLKLSKETPAELEEAKKLVGTWVFIRDLRKAVFLVEDVERNNDKNLIIRANDNWHYSHEVTPATLPTAAPKWRCMKTDIPETCSDKLIKLDGTYHLA